MNKLKITVAVVLCSVIISAVIYNVYRNTLATAKITAQNISLNQLRDYKKWQQVTVRAAPMSPDVAELCVAPRMGDRDLQILKAQASPQNPHTRKYFRVYVNDKGKKAMLSYPPSRYPVGTVIVKEKLSSLDSKNPELLTVMIKKQPGFNKVSGDWEYLVVNGNATKVEANSEMEHCYGCHATQKSSDYVFRSYEVAFKLDFNLNKTKP